jgi:nucleotide-binding universal stress UspA family protein
MSASFLVAVDFSTLTDRTVAFAVRQASRRHGDRLDLLHVITSSSAIPTLGHPAAQDVLDQVTSEDEQVARRTLGVLMNATVPPELRGKPIVGRGTPADVICATARDGYEMVVLSTHGRTGLQHMLLGSVAERVVRYCTVPVLVVR